VAKDVLGLVQKPNGKIEAGGEEHDDCIMSKLIGHYVYNNANLEEWDIIKGAKEPLSESNSPKSEAENLKELHKLLPHLPESLRNLIIGAKGKDPVSDANNYYKQIEMERSFREATRESNMNTTQSPHVGRSVLENSDKLWNDFYKSQSANEFNQNQSNSFNPYGNNSLDPYTSNEFNIEDYL